RLAGGMRTPRSRLACRGRRLAPAEAGRARDATATREPAVKPAAASPFRPAPGRPTPLAAAVRRLLLAAADGPAPMVDPVPRHPPRQAPERGAVRRPPHSAASNLALGAILCSRSSHSEASTLMLRATPSCQPWLTRPPLAAACSDRAALR